MTPITKLFQLLLNCVLWYLTINQIILPLASILLIVIIIRSSEKILFKVLYNAEPFTMEEIPWCHKESQNLPVINVVLFMENAPHVNELRSIVQKRMLDDFKDENGFDVPSRGKQRMVSGFLNYYWVNEKDFDIDKHIYEKSELYNSLQELKDAISNVSTVPFDEDISPWEFLMFNYLDDDENKSAIMFRIHHAMADGGSLIYFLLNKLSDEKSLQIKPRRFTNIEKLYVMGQAYLNIPLLAIKQLLPYSPKHTLHCTKASGRKTFTWSDPIPLPLIQSIKTNLKVTINDVMLGTLATSFHDYFKETGEPVPNELMAAFPVDVRSSIEEAMTFSNKFAILPIPLPTSSGDNIANIHQLHNTMKEVKELGLPITYHAGMCVFNYFLPSIANDLIQTTFINKTSLVLSNVAGPQVTTKLGGNKIDSICFWPAPKYNLGMSCSIFSYQNNVIIGYSYDNALEIDVDFILKRIPAILNDTAALLEDN